MLSVLFDLDDTLIHNNAGLFSRIYPDRLSDYHQDLVNPQIFKQAMYDGIRQMISKTCIAGSLEETFDRSFYPAIGLSKESLSNRIDDFYTTEFPALKSETTPCPIAQNVIAECISKGWEIAIATNPLFPFTAVQQRLQWANLDSGMITYAVITSYETCHFAKPQPAFFSEVKARIEGFDHPVVMIGNDLHDDIIPSGLAGIPSFWLTDSKDPLPADLPEGSSKGRMENVKTWLKTIESITPREPATITSLLSSLRGGAAAIDTIVKSVPQTRWTKKLNEIEWSITEILCHLRDLEQEINLRRVKTILQQHQPFVAGIATDGWAVERKYNLQNGFEALGQYISGREELILLLENADEEDWGRMIRHSIFGPTTLKEMISFIVDHDNNHIKQIKKQINTCCCSK